MLLGESLKDPCLARNVLSNSHEPELVFPNFVDLSFPIGSRVCRVYDYDLGMRELGTIYFTQLESGIVQLKNNLKLDFTLERVV